MSLTDGNGLRPILVAVRKGIDAKIGACWHVVGTEHAAKDVPSVWRACGPDRHLVRPAAPCDKETVVGCHAEDRVGAEIRQGVDLELIVRGLACAVVYPRIDIHVINQESAGTIRFR